MLTDGKGNRVVIGNVGSLKAQVEDIMKADLGYALEGIDIKVKKSGADIYAALEEKMRRYLAEYAEIESKMEAKEELFPQYGINMPNKRVHADGYEYDSIYSANNFDENTPVEVMNCVREWSNLYYQCGAVKKDIKAAKAMMAMIDKKSTYPLRMKEYSILFQ